MANKPKKVVRSWVKPRVAFDRKVSYQSFYNARKWRNTSKAYREANPICECEDCKREDIVKKAEVCDHVRGLGYLLDNGIDPYDWNELQSMSHECHNKKSGSESHRSQRGMG
ncbi:hypothetical protein [Flavobacterium sp. SLB02]|uniref:hypothetical protein n=1 Tax=Flavobacterium sp. SLB02 TaxID=2665645 RepID=UPI0012A7DE6B|nr:hypothetical protein [Flavobacterium sp. SLB02]QGK72828.1 hypothetical protein GIY83_01700 [Flavobacterium sp. SLB02]